MNVRVIKAEEARVNRKRGVTAEQLRVAPYCRVSTDSEEQQLSYKSQVLHYRNMVETNPAWELVDIYADEGISGTRTNKRTAFQKMINDAVDGKIDLIITKSIARFARNTLDTLKYVRLLKEHNVAIVFEKENINTLTMNGEMLLAILSSIAQQESESISANVKMGLKMKMKRGELVGFQGCLGYDYNPEDKTLSVNEVEAETVRYIFRRYSEGAGTFLIAKELTLMKARTKRGNTRWCDSSISKIIKNEKYKGDLLLGKTFTVDPISHRRLENMGEEEKYYVTDHHEPIIDEDLFEEVHLILKKRSSKHNDKGRGEKYSRKYAFSSKIECGFCGNTAIRRKWHSSTTHETYNWQCGCSINKGKVSCPDSKGMRESIIEESFVNAFNRINEVNRDLIDEFLTTTEEALGIVANKKERTKLIKEIDSLKAKGHKLLELRLSDKIDEESYSVKYDELEERVRKLKEVKENLDLKIDDESALERRIKTFRKIFNTETPLEEFDRLIFDSLVEKVILGDTDDDGNRTPYVVKFILNTGLVVDGITNKGGTNQADEPSSFTSLEKTEACSNIVPDTFGSDNSAGA